MNDNLSARLKVADEHKAAMLDSALLSIVDLQKAFMQAGDQGIAELHKASNEEEPREAARHSQQILMRLDLENMEPIIVDDQREEPDLNSNKPMFSPRSGNGAGIMGLATPSSVSKGSPNKFTEVVAGMKNPSNGSANSGPNQYIGGVESIGSKTPSQLGSKTPSQLYASGSKTPSQLYASDSGFTIPGVTANPALRSIPTSSNKTVKVFSPLELSSCPLLILSALSLSSFNFSQRSPFPFEAQGSGLSHVSLCLEGSWPG